MNIEKQTFSRLQAIALVILRVIIGWHFLYEGIAKMLKPNWSASGYLLQSRGMFAGLFHWMADNQNILDVVNQLNMWGLTCIGLGLMLGCFTRLASLAGILVIALFYVCNPPFVGYFYSIPMEGNYMIINKNFVEAAGLLVVLVTNSGKFFGIDQIIHRLLSKSVRIQEA
jgi:thiosulfate dehydrogenase [quinone] large subunit